MKRDRSALNSENPPNGVRVRATGSFLPVREVRNEELTQFPRSALPLIQQKTGIQARHYAAPTQCTSDLATEAGRACLSQANMDALDVDAIVLATSSPDRIQPATATRLQSLLGTKRAFAFDVKAVCSGSVFALEVGRSLIEGGTINNVLVVASEVYSKILDPEDFETWPYFGDGAGAVLLERGNSGPLVTGSILHTNGDCHDVIQVPAGGTMKPYAEMRSPREQYFAMNGKQVYEFAVTYAPKVLREILSLYSIPAERVSWVVPHQANIKIINAISAASGIPRERFFTNLERYGNTAGASVFIALDELRRFGLALPGHIIVLLAFGGGLTWCASVIQCY